MVTPNPSPVVATQPAPMPLGADEDSRIVKALGQIQSLLVPGETIEAYAVQRRLFALEHRRVVVAATTGRFIGMVRHWLGGFDPHDIRWQDLKDARLQMGTFAANLTLVAFSSPDLASGGQLRTLSFTGLRKTQAEAVYRVCQANEQAWREKRRIRELEELRAKSGGIQLGAATAGAAAAGGSSDPVAKLEQAKAMRDKGLITDSEYESLKARIVSSL